MAWSRLVAGPDIMSVPALASFLQASLMEVFSDNMLWCRPCSLPSDLVCLLQL